MQEDDPAACWEANAETWTRQTRAGYDVYRDYVNTPAFFAMLPPVVGLSGLDLGCGEGHNTRKLARLGARVRAIDVSPTFIRHAREAEAAEPLGIDYEVADAQSIPAADASLDFVTSFMCLMDVADPVRALREIGRVLKPGGFVQFSILHPCFAPPHRKVLREPDGAARAVEVAEYFAAGPWTDRWWFSQVSEEERRTIPPFRAPYVHMTLGMWLDAVRGAGLVLERLGEPTVSAATARAVPVVADMRVAGLFLHILAIKPVSFVRSGKRKD